MVESSCAWLGVRRRRQAAGEMGRRKEESVSTRACPGSARLRLLPACGSLPVKQGLASRRGAGKEQGGTGSGERTELFGVRAAWLSAKEELSNEEELLLVVV
mgnify:FL=1